MRSSAPTSPCATAEQDLHLRIRASERKTTMDIEGPAPESLLAAIVESSDDAIISINLEGSITSWNRGAERVYGYTAAEAIGEPVSIIAAPERDEMPTILEQIGRGERIDHYQTIRRAKDGRRVDVSLTVSPICDAQGRIVGASKIARDITARNLAESTLAKQAEQLARSNADLQQFAYITAHDLKEPLRTVIACTEMFVCKSGERLNPEERQLLDFVTTAARRMDEMIAALLPYTRTMHQELPLSTVKISEVVNWAVNNLYLSIEASQVRISCDEAQLPMVRGNKVALAQLFQNLLDNAIKYRGPDSPVVEISAQRADGNWLFRVRDNGIGIHPAYHKRIFTLFQRLHTSEEVPGTGVGLALCQRIVQAHGGRIWVESEEGKGATFVFNLPAGEGT
jgi:PAS domain S-box-containing protein